MKKFTLFWKDGKREVVEGNDPADAMNRRGYGLGALAALDFFDHGENDLFKWNSKTREWDLK